MSSALLALRLRGPSVRNEFYATHRYANFGNLGAALHARVSAGQIVRVSDLEHITACLQHMINKLRSTGVENCGFQLIALVRACAGNAHGASDLFHNRSFLAVASEAMRRCILRGVDNVYTEHEPLLAHTLDALFRSKAGCMDFLFIHPPAHESADFVHPTRTVVVVMVGGSLLCVRRHQDRVRRTLQRLRVGGSLLFVRRHQDRI